MQPGSTKFPRYSLSDNAEILGLLALFDRDSWNSVGKEIDSDENKLRIRDWPE